jgi:hypothetical protein
MVDRSVSHTQVLLLRRPLSSPSVLLLSAIPNASLLALLYVYVPVRENDYFPKAVRGTSLQRLATASPQYDYTEQGPSTD